MAETRDRSNFFDDSVRKRQKKKKKEGKEEKLKDAWRKVGSFDHEAGGSKKKREDRKL